MDNTFYFNRYITQKKAKLLRITELVCCTACFALAVTVFQIRLYSVTKVILTVVSTTFLFITLVDATSWLQSRPMGHRTWIIFSIVAFHTFSLCGGFLVFLKRITNQRLLLATCIVNFVTGYVFLLDSILIVLEYIKWIHRNDTRVAPISRRVDRAVSTCLMQDEWERLSTAAPRLRSTLRNRPYGVPSYSYGGTFAVSKDLPPLPTPDPLREFSPRRRMYCTLVNPNTLSEGSGDYNKIDLESPLKKTEVVPFSITKNKKVDDEKSSTFTEGRAQIPECKSAGSQSYAEECTAVPCVGSKQKRDKDTNASEKNDTSNQRQKSEEMIVAYCKQEGSNTPISMQDCVFHQYYQQPCLRCGRTHYQQQTTINGTLICPPTVCSPKNENIAPLQIIQLPCGNNLNCPGLPAGVQQIMGPCVSHNCPNVQEKKNCTCSSTSMKRNGLQPEYVPYRKYAVQVSQDCPPCGRRHGEHEGYEDRPVDTYCRKDCPHSNMYAQTQPCRCCYPPAAVVAETSTEQEQLRNSEVMAVQEMKDKDVQIKRHTTNDNPQTSETRIINASFLDNILASKCDPKCTGNKSSGQQSSNGEEDTTDMTWDTEEHEPSVSAHKTPRESKTSKASKPTRSSKISKTASSRSKPTRLTAGGPLETSEHEPSVGRSNEIITDPEPEEDKPVLSMKKSSERQMHSKFSKHSQETEKKLSKVSYSNMRHGNANEQQHHMEEPEEIITDPEPEEEVEPVPSMKKSSERQMRSKFSKQSIQSRPPTPPKKSLRHAAHGKPNVEPEIQKSHIETRLESAPKKLSVCECMELGKPSKDCKRIRSQRAGECEKTVSYRDLPQEVSSDESIHEITYDDAELEPESADQPVEEPLMHKTIVTKLGADQKPSVQSGHKVASPPQNNIPEEPELEMHEPPMRSKRSIREPKSESQRELSIKSKNSSHRMESQKSEHESSVASRQVKKGSAYEALVSSRLLSKDSIHEPSIREVDSQKSARAPSKVSHLEPEIQADRPSPKTEEVDSDDDRLHPPRVNEEWCARCCTEKKCKPKKKFWSFLKKKK